ncbi:helix-turn-helix transcriptional regulator [Staphylococcus hyicus]|uniref:helix-turn-helix domain-containing protein n=1 Tax=Staphylococcus hyicus TaxID=1284 RepID=UPI002A83A503|nr:helix-turn-helix transcriptional regulator [Staphylococcus hyicus]
MLHSQQIHVKVITVANTQLEMRGVKVIGGYPKLKKYLKDNNISQQEIADLLGYSREKVNTIINGTSRYGTDFSGRDIRLMHEKYGININHYFFNYEVANKQL